MLVQMAVSGLSVDPTTNAPIVILREINDGRVLPIWIGVVEASAIAFELEGIKLTRPMTHDLMRAAIMYLGGTIESVRIAELRGNTYHAVVVLAQGERRLEMDARPSDAIAIALRMQAPIFCDDAVIGQAQARRAGDSKKAQIGNDGDDEDVDRGEDGPRPILETGDKPWSEILESLEPDAFGKYKM